jgi:hypothetical protein
MNILPDQPIPSPVAAGVPAAPPRELSPADTVKALAAARAEVDAGLPPGTVLQNSTDAQPPSQDPRAWLKMLQQSNGVQVSPTVNGGGDWSSAKVFENVKTAAQKSQDELMSRMFGNGKNPALSDTSVLPLAVDRYLDKTLDG